MFAQPHLFSKSWLARLHRHRLLKFLTSATRVAATAEVVAVLATAAAVAIVADTAVTVMVVAAVRVAEATSVATARVVGQTAHPTPSVALVVKTQKAKNLLTVRAV